MSDTNPQPQSPWVADEAAVPSLTDEEQVLRVIEGVVPFTLPDGETSNDRISAIIDRAEHDVLQALIGVPREHIGAAAAAYFMHAARYLTMHACMAHRNDHHLVMKAMTEAAELGIEAGHDLAHILTESARELAKRSRT